VDDEKDLPILFKAVSFERLFSTSFLNPPLSQSRFRRPHERGVFYASAEIETAMAEVAFHRHAFLKLSKSSTATSVTMASLSAQLHGQLLDVELLGNKDAIYSTESYEHAQSLASEVRAESIPGIHYLSVRSKPRKSNFAIFDPRILRPVEGLSRFWVATFSLDKIEFHSPDSTLTFDPKTWS
jgi:hypothetical protein